MQCYEIASPVGDDLERLGAELRMRYDWIWTHDFTQDVESAKAPLRSEGSLTGQ
jgi:salicylate hydroxylase